MRLWARLAQSAHDRLKGRRQMEWHPLTNLAIVASVKVFDVACADSFHKESLGITFSYPVGNSKFAIL